MTRVLGIYDAFRFFEGADKGTEVILVLPNRDVSDNTEIEIRDVFLSLSEGQMTTQITRETRGPITEFHIILT